MDSPVSIRDGAIFWHDAFKSPDDAARLAEEFERVLAGDWFAPFSLKYAADLRTAIDLTSVPEKLHAAA